MCRCRSPIQSRLINTVNDSNNINLYNDNTSDQFNTEMDGFTITMTITIHVNSGVVNSIKIGIADVADSNYDSNLLIAADSVQAQLVALDDQVTMQDRVTKKVDVLDNDINNTTGTLTVTHINGNPVVAGQTITLPTGQTVKLWGGAEHSTSPPTVISKPAVSPIRSSPPTAPATSLKPTPALSLLKRSPVLLRGP
jgi:hypothetical protein